jgi:hypothetical protein
MPADGGCYVFVSYGRNVWGFGLIAFWTAAIKFYETIVSSVMLEACDTSIAAMSLHCLVSQNIFTLVTKSQM